MSPATDLRARLPLCLVAAILAALSLALPRTSHAAPESAQIIAVTATDSVFEDRVVVLWPRTARGDAFYRVRRDGQLLSVVARTDSSYADVTGTPGRVYSYSVQMVDVAADTIIDVGADQGSRVLAMPAGVRATDGTLDTRVVVTWSDRSIVEVGYVVRRDGAPLDTVPANQEAFADNGRCRERRTTTASRPSTGRATGPAPRATRDPAAWCCRRRGSRRPTASIRPTWR